MPARVRTTKTAEVSKRGDTLTLGMIAEAAEEFAAVGAADGATVKIGAGSGVVLFEATWQIATEGSPE